jgi:membrane fusion protein, multidrug efflux system
MAGDQDNAAAKTAAAPVRRAGRGRWLAAAALVLVTVAALVMWHYSGRVSTDDAQIDGHITQVSAQVGGTIVTLHVKENQHVDAGAVIAEIDPRDYRVAVERAKADLADAAANLAAAKTGIPIGAATTSSGVSNASGGVEQAQAGVGLAERQVEGARAELAAAEARLREKEATAAKTARDVERLKALVAKDEIAQQQYDATVWQADAARASLDAAKSDVAAARAAIGVAEHRVQQARGAATQAQAALQESKTAPEQMAVTRSKADMAEARVKQFTAALAQAELNLERTTIRAPTAGTISRKSIEAGQVVQPGQPLLAIVADTEVWVTANFKETQLKEMRIGQRASIDVDALGGGGFRGHVESIAAATGAKFSLLPPENATGNYVKVVQRVPVKIALEPGQDPEHRLRPGMSVQPTVYVK